jgi:hypothetical protein
MSCATKKAVFSNLLGGVVDGERRGTRHTLSLTLDQVTKAVAHYAVEVEPQPPGREPPHRGNVFHR